MVRQERCAFGLARARNNGARAAGHDILLFLDSEMLVEADWIAAHARWHHVVSDAVTLGPRSHVAMDGIDVETIRRRTGSVQELLSDRPVRRPWVEDHLSRTSDLTSRADDPFTVMIGGNFGIGKGFYRSVGGCDESFMRWGTGLEDTELCYRAYTRGGVLVPVRDAAAWHQGSWEEDRDAKRRTRRILRSKAAHLIAHDSLRRRRPGRIFAVPQYVVTIDAGRRPAGQLIRTAGNILADHVHDLVVRIETPARDADDDRLAWLRDEFGADPRVRVGATGAALDEFPAASFHVRLPATAVFARGLVHRLRVKLGDAVTAVSMLPDGSTVSITRAWALHRARRTTGKPADFGELRSISAHTLKLRVAEPSDEVDDATATGTDYPDRWERLLDRMRDIHGPGDGWSFLKWLIRSVWTAGRRFFHSKREGT